MKPDPLKPSATLLIKLGSIAVHADEMNTYGFNPTEHAFNFDRGSLITLFNDPEVTAWISAMTKMAFLPVKRNKK